MSHSKSYDSMERLVPEFAEQEASTLGRQTLLLHLERYEFAAKFLTEGHIADIACGVGYGTKLLATSTNVEHITGVDRSESAITYAKENYSAANIRYVLSDAYAFSGRDTGYDGIVSLETIEHVPDPKKLITHFKTLLKPGGVFVGSVPVTPSVDANPHHLNDFTVKSFKQLFTDRGFSLQDELLQKQPFNPFELASKKDTRAQDLRPNLLAYYFKNPKAAYKRIASTLKDGFTNKYLTTVWRLS